MTARAVLLDFAGTLLVPAPAAQWVRAVTGTHDPALAEALERAGRPGGPEPVALPEHLADDYAHRDDATTRHRAVYVALLEQVCPHEQAVALYEASCTAASWEPYPDTAPTLRALRAAGIGLAVVSNVGFDLPALLTEHGLAELVDVVVQSHELGVSKPDPRLFTTALEQLGVDAAEALMVGDNPTSDGAAVDLGITTLLLPWSPPGRDHGLAAVLDLAGLRR